MNTTKTTKRTDTKLTDKELAVLTAIDASEYGDNICDAVWAWSIAQNCPTLPATSIGGIVASLQKKKLVTTSDVGTRDAATAMTDEGARMYAAAVGDKRRKWIDDADLAAMRARDEAKATPAAVAEQVAPATKPKSEWSRVFTRFQPVANFTEFCKAHPQLKVHSDMGGDSWKIPVNRDARYFLMNNAERADVPVAGDDHVDVSLFTHYGEQLWFGRCSWAEAHAMIEGQSI